MKQLLTALLVMGWVRLDEGKGLGNKQLGRPVARGMKL